MPFAHPSNASTTEAGFQPKDDQAATSLSAKRQRKREIDRRCQRQARERTKSRVAYLEKLVEDLQRQDAGGRMQAMLTQLTRVQKERNSLSQTLKEIQKAVSDHQTVANFEPSSSLMQIKSTSPPSPVRCDHSPTLVNSPRSLESRLRSSEVRLADANSQQQPQTPVFGPLPASVAASGFEESLIVPQPNKNCHCTQEGFTDGSKNIWRYTNDTLLKRYKGDDQISPIEDYLADEIAVRVLLDGWDSVQTTVGLTKSWEIVRGIDEISFSKLPPTERLALLKQLHLHLLYHLEPTPERYARLPSWMLQRPSQGLTNSYAVNFIVWPGLRERFVFHQHHYCSNSFWELLLSGLRLQWTYEFRDCFSRRADTGVHEISPLFYECIGDISRWRMDSDVFAQYPELRSDIATASSVPKAVSNTLQLQMANAESSRRAATNVPTGQSLRRFPGFWPVQQASAQGKQRKVQPASATQDVVSEQEHMKQSNDSRTFSPGISELSSAQTSSNVRRF